MEAENRCCSECLAPYDEIIAEITTKSLGEESLTEQQQAFLEQVFNHEVPDRCPICMD